MLALAIAAALFAPAVRAQEATMTASAVEGMVTVRLAAGGPPGPIAEGDPLHDGDTVQTAPGARLEISLSTGSVLRLGENSHLRLGAAVPKKAFSARLFFGNLWTKVHKLIAQETFHIETENAVAGVRGTEFRIEVAPGKEDLLRVYEGAVQVDAHDGKWSHRVEPGSELRFHRDRPPAGPRPFDPSSEAGHAFMKWVRSRPTKAGLEPGRIRRPEFRNPEREHRVREKVRKRDRDQ
jgi:ferric-dicitrate binding protein FerR (iron transport regulator)